MRVQDRGVLAPKRRINPMANNQKQLTVLVQKIAVTTLVLVELFDFKFVARGKVNVVAPEVSAPPKSSIAR